MRDLMMGSDTEVCGDNVGRRVPCPQCTRCREKLDREKMAKVAYEHMFPDRYGWEKETDEHLLSNYRNLADHYIKYLTEYEGM